MDIFKRLAEGIETESPEATEALARALAPALPENCTLALFGDLGVGKTTFVRGLARAWGIENHITSPSFSVYNLYRGKTRQLCHLDAYRLSSPAEYDALMLDEFLEPPYGLVDEWPQRILDSLPPDTIKIEWSIVRDGVHRARLLA